MKKTLLLGALTLALFGSGCISFPREKLYKEEELFHWIENTTAQAVFQKDVTICEVLSVDAVYQNGDKSRGSLVHYSVQPRERCYWGFVQNTNQEAACEGLDSLEHTTVTSGSECYEYLAQAKNDISLCSKMEYGGAVCRAKVSKSIEPCYDVQKDEHDISKYSRVVQSCIGSVALRLKRIEPCLEINGPEYGEQWRVGRNACLEHVAAVLKLKDGNLTPICEKMVEDKEGFDHKERCLKGELVSNIEQMIPPYGDGVGY